MTLHSTTASVDAIEAEAERLAVEAGLDEDERFNVTMAAREAAVNAVLHGNDYDPAKQITASFENTGAALRDRHRRPGPGAGPGDASRPAGAGESAARFGRGIFLMRSFMDEVLFHQLHPGLELTLVKHLTLAPVAEERPTGPEVQHRRRATFSAHAERVPPCEQAEDFRRTKVLQYNRRCTNKEEFPWH